MNDIGPNPMINSTGGTLVTLVPEDDAMMLAAVSSPLTEGANFQGGGRQGGGKTGGDPRGGLGP